MPHSMGSFDARKTRIRPRRAEVVHRHALRDLHVVVHQRRHDDETVDPVEQAAEARETLHGVFRLKLVFDGRL